MKDSLLALDLFCGCGGLSLGLQRAGFQVVAAVDNWSLAIDTYKRNFSHRVLQADVSKLTPQELLGGTYNSWPTIDLIAGGPPCQGFSIQRIGDDSDPRNNLVVDYGKLIVAISPRAFLMENVAGLMGARGRLILRSFYDVVQKGGYEITSAILNAADYGIPQVRKRVFFVGWRKDGDKVFHFPAPTHGGGRHKNVMDAIGDLPEPPAKNQATDPLHFKTKLSALNEKRIRLIPPGGGFESLPRELRANCHKNGAQDIGHRYVYGRLAPQKPAATITARFDSFTRGRFGHPVQHRNISLREGARLQTFPDSFEFVGSQEAVAAQIGNAVPPAMAAVLADQIAKFLRTEAQEPLFRKQEFRLGLA